MAVVAFSSLQSREATSDIERDRAWTLCLTKSTIVRIFGA